MLTFDENLDCLKNLTTHRHATLWKIVRRDNVTFRFTDHDGKLTYNEEVYTPSGGWNASARRKRDSLGGQDFEATGIISSSTVTTEDLRKGLYDGAAIYEYLVDWRYPWAGAFRTAKYFISSIRYNGREWYVTLEGLTQKLKHRVGGVYGRGCRHVLGSVGCGVAISDYTYRSAAVVSVSSDRLEFTAEHASFAGLAADWFNFGALEWTAGGNSGVQSEVEDSHAALGTQVYFDLRLQTPADINVGDTFTVKAGCDKTFATCSSKFDNVINFGGFHLIPGPDKLLVSPW